MTPGSNPLPPLAAPETASAPADRPVTVSRGNRKLIPELSAVLSGCALIAERDEGAGFTLSVTPLQFIGLSDASGRLKADLPRFHHAHGRL